MFVVVTGASRGIGLQIVKQLLELDHTVLAVSRHTSSLHSISAPKLIVVRGDITQTAVRTLIKNKIKGVSSRVDVLINNAGHLVSKPFASIHKEELLACYNVNLFAPFLLTQALLPLMGKKSVSHIVNIGSIGGVQGSAKFPGLSAYSSSKGAVSVLTECLAEELREQNIRCNCLALGAVQTEMLNKAFPGYKAPIGPEKMAEFITEFALNGHQYFNGKVLQVSSTTP
jgi:3-oxoacyl-[acyl-carrier protein] reductase